MTTTTAPPRTSAPSTAGSRRGSRREERFILVEGKPRDITEVGWSDGNALVPPPGATEWGEMECAIIERWLGKYRDLNEEKNHEVQECAEAYALNEQIPERRDIDLALSRARQSVPRLLGSSRERLTRLQEIERDAYRDRHDFRKDNGIKHEATFPESTINHFAIVIAIVLVESFANMYFFAQGSSLGYLGGLLQSILLSLINVGVAVAVGRFVLRAIHHRHPGFKFGGALAFVLYLAFLFGFNLVVGHYRDLFTVRPEDALTQALPDTFAAPFAISFDSLMLLIAGFLAAGLGAYKGYGSDDRYPGYGKLERRYRLARADYDLAKVAIRSELHAVLDRLNAELEGLRAKAKSQVKVLEETLTRGEKLRESYAVGLQDCDGGCRQWLVEYRTANMNVRGQVEPPPCFGTFKDMPSALDVETLDTFPARLKAAKRAQVELVTALEQEEKRGEKRVQELEAELKRFFDGLAAHANSSREAAASGGKNDSDVT